VAGSRGSTRPGRESSFFFPRIDLVERPGSRCLAAGAYVRDAVALGLGPLASTTVVAGGRIQLLMERPGVSASRAGGSTRVFAAPHEVADDHDEEQRAHNEPDDRSVRQTDVPDSH